jgi:hypothetical protein
MSQKSEILNLERMMKMNERERIEQRMEQLKEYVMDRLRRMSAEELFEMLSLIICEGMRGIEREKEMEENHVKS